MNIVLGNTISIRVRDGILHPSPAYIWRPDQLARRSVHSLRGVETRLVTLPWKASLEVDTADRIGSGIARLGVHELAVTEVMWRLTDPVDLALDLGANIGYFTSLLAIRARAVIALEPHPEVAARLRANADRWPCGDVRIDERAASGKNGAANLVEPPGFEVNAGTAGLREDAAEDGRAIQVQTVRIDDVIGGERVGILKLDVEGHEYDALSGGRRALEEGRVRDIFFEDHDPMPTAVGALLESYGYRLFSIRQRLSRPVLGGPTDPAPRWDAPTYLATLDPERAGRRVESFGWRCLRPS
jgi:FkbM family methyltransferase